MGSRASKQAAAAQDPQDGGGGGGGADDGPAASGAAEDGDNGGGSGAGESRRSRRRRRRRRGSTSSSELGESDAALMEQAPRLSYWQMMRGGYEELVHAIIRPPRAEYSEAVLGPEVFTVDGVIFEREDLKVRNRMGLELACSHWKPRSLKEDNAHPMPCVIYLHGNASCRAEALETLPLILSSGMSLFAFDFAGSGHSEGEYISLGWYEREDLEAVVDHLRASGKTSTIGLWGRSMGAATALMFAERDPSIAAMVLDSPFASLKQLAKELSSEVNVPHFLMGMALRMVRSSVRSRARFDIFKLEPIKHVETSFTPALFGHGQDDRFILPHHSQQLYDVYPGDKNIILFEGDHSSSRPAFFNDSVGIFLYNTMISTTPQASDTVGHADQREFDFVLGYTIPPPMASPSGDGVRSPSGSLSAGLGAQAAGPTAGGAPTNDFYEEAMLRHAIQLSLAESQGSPGDAGVGGGTHGIGTDEIDADLNEVEEDEEEGDLCNAKNGRADEGGVVTRGDERGDDDGDSQADDEAGALAAAIAASMAETEIEVEVEAEAMARAQHSDDAGEMQTPASAPASAPKSTRPPAPGVAGARSRPAAHPRPPAPTKPRAGDPLQSDGREDGDGRIAVKAEAGGFANGDAKMGDRLEDDDDNDDDDDDENEDFPSMDGVPLPLQDRHKD